MIEAVPDRPEGAPVFPHRRWSEGFKAEMVARSLELGTNVSALAREIGIRPQQLFGWRKSARAERRGPLERMAELGSEAATDARATAIIEIGITGATIRVGTDIGEAQLRRVIRAVSSG